MLSLPVACAECNVGAMKCFGTGVDRCCNFYNPSDGRCLQECQADRLVTDDFDCTGRANSSRRPCYVTHKRRYYIYSKTQYYVPISNNNSRVLQSTYSVSNNNRNAAEHIRMNYEYTVKHNIMFSL